MESGVRVVKMTDLTAGIPRKLYVGPYPAETRYCGQVPQCGRCGQFGHRVATCINDVNCFRCGKDGHVQRQCFKCFLCGQFGHVRSTCPDNPTNRQAVESSSAAAVADVSNIQSSDAPVVQESSVENDVPPESNHKSYVLSVLPDQVLTESRNDPDDSQSQSLLSDEGDKDMNSDASEDPNDADNVRGPDSVVRREQPPILPPESAVELNKRHSETITEAARLLNQKRRRRSKKNKH